MSVERRYTDEEIAAIFRQATQAQESAQRTIPHGEGLTLSELQDIGREAGITPEFVARAAAAVDHSVPPPSPVRYLGLPISVTRTANLPNQLTEAGWDRLVVDLRDTFQATGEVRRDGAVREWRNGNLHALAEPTDSGYRLRLSTRKGNAQESLTLSLAALAMGLLFFTLMAMNTEPEPGMQVIMALFIAVGLGGTGFTAFRLSRWEKERGRQMEALIVRAEGRSNEPSAAESAVREAAPVDRLDPGIPDEPADAGIARGRQRDRA